MDLYDEKEHIISSDEYSDDDDDDDALMNDAVRAQDYNFPSGDYGDRNKQPKWRMDQKQKELSSLIRRNKISVIYKNKSIKWLNNKRQRERYKEHIYLNAKKSKIEPIIASTASNEEKNTNEEKCETIHIADVVSIEDDEPDFANNTNNKVIMGENNVLPKSSSLSTFQYNEVVNIQPAKQSKNPNEKNITTEGKIHEHMGESRRPIEKIKEVPEKRARSSSPSTLNESNETEIKNDEKKFRAKSPQFYKSINEMFPKFDKIATNHIDTIANTTLNAAEEKMKSLSNEIDTLNEILHTKELEWNRLLHLKMVKEEIYSRLSQKRHTLQLKESYTKKQGQNTLLELKELELYLSEKKANSSEANNSSITIQKLIENRANMNAEDLEREKNNTSRLHSLLVSRNMLHGTDSSENPSVIINGDTQSLGVASKNSEFYNHLDGGCSLSNRGRQGEFRDVKSLIADFRQKNPELLPRVGKRIKSSESNAQHHNFSIPLFEKTSSRPQYFSKEHQHEYYPLPNSVEEISITPIGRAKKLSSSHDIDFVNTMNNPYNIRLEETYMKNPVKRDFDGKCPKNIQYPLCQECKTNESRFVCAGCGNQWYCSKKCQISAWDKHSELCTE
ncbi:uncharacterized protein LOC119609531 [Lucilia sericata]|uniref:uncharacterized protein LOC119609531 n=1 Tax=Lucilia sericata TaxID=13632 RepID=UPI0018A7F96E|nr:uncharacterized protein LOC119609531 [Lucilia sericata]